MNLSTTNEPRARKVANELLFELSKTYYPAIPNGDIDAVLRAVGFRELEPGIYCGHEGRMSEQVGPKSWFTMTWYKMPSGSYEIVAYVSQGK
jgi:hypothetical protein